MSEPNNPLQLEGITALVAGNGGIGSALAARLLDNYPVDQLFCLQRSEVPCCDDPRVVTIYCDAADPDSIRSAGKSVVEQCERLHVAINAVGMLHAEDIKPEKRLADVSLESLLYTATINAFFLPQLATALAPSLRHAQPSILASISARVGSITDNGMGGWYSYRASKAAHNMLLKTLSREWRVSHKRCSVVALHPGTVQTGLSAPYTPANYRKRVLAPAESAAALLNVLEVVSADQTGTFLSWEGEQLPW